jgi:hypothetical protein
MTYPNFPYGVNMTLVKRTVSGQDMYGNDVYDETSTVIGNCVFQPAGSTENLTFADQVNTTDTIFMPFGTPVGPLDAIDFNGNRYEVIGEISSWVSPFSGRTSPIRINVSKIAGVSAA